MHLNIFEHYNSKKHGKMLLFTAICCLLYFTQLFFSAMLLSRKRLAGSKSLPQGGKVCFLLQAPRWRHQGTKVVVSSQKAGRKVRTFDHRMEKIVHYTTREEK